MKFEEFKNGEFFKFHWPHIKLNTKGLKITFYYSNQHQNEISIMTKFSYFGTFESVATLR
jgi:hypothetical protein